MFAITLDIGGTSVKSAIVTEQDSKTKITHRFDTTHASKNNFTGLKDAVFSAVGQALRVNNEITYVGISTSGTVTKEGLLAGGHFYDGYDFVSWKQILCERFPTLAKVVVANDGNAAALGEFAVRDNNAATDLTHFVAGTGVGGGIIIGGKLFVGAGGFAGELGQIVVSTHNPVPGIGTGTTGGVEMYASKLGIIRYVKEKIGEGTRSALSSNLSQLTEDSKDAIGIISRTAHNNDQLAYEAFAVAGGWLGVAIATAINILNPHIITIGGGIVEASPRTPEGANLYVQSAQQRAQELATPRIFAMCSIMEAKLGNDGGLVGAGALALS